MKIEKVAVLGAGTMGHGIAHVSALAGYEVSVFDIADEAVERGLASIGRNMQKGSSSSPGSSPGRHPRACRPRGAGDAARSRRC